MSKHEKAVALVNQGLEALALEIDRHLRGVGRVGDLQQLRAFQQHLDLVRDQLKAHQIPEGDFRSFGMGRTIVDTWPLDSELGSLLCAAEQACREIP